jgi:hypothetical protein
MSNFLAETVNFFLGNSQLTYFTSDASNNFKFVDGRIYKMKLRIEKSDNFSMFTTGTNNFVPFESLFGPPVAHNFTTTLGFFGLSSSATSITEKQPYAPFAPSYFREGANFEIAYTAGLDNSLENILNNLVITEITDSFDYLPSIANTTASIAFYQRMPLTASINFNKAIEVKKIQFEATTNKPQTVSDSDSGSPPKKWIIQTKFESPLINYTNYSSTQTQEQTIDPAFAVEGISVDGSSNVSSSFIDLKYKYSSINGIWNRLGEIPEDKNSIQLSITDDGYAYSLLEACGFKRETKSISQLAESKKIYEGILLLPFVQNAKYLFLNREEKEKFQRIDDSSKDGKLKWTFKIDVNFVNSILKTNDYKKLTIKEIKTILETDTSIDKTSILYKTMKSMVDYNVPPYLNWLVNKALSPFAMYIAEFEHELSKQDLANIWQGTMPQIALSPEEQTISIEHSLFDNNFFNKFSYGDLNKLDVKLKILKIKKRAEYSYNRMLDNVENNSKFLFEKDYSADSPEWYSFNWPYDYFSLVELVNVQVGEIFDLAEEQERIARISEALQSNQFLDNVQQSIQESLNNGSITLGTGLSSGDIVSNILSNINSNNNNNNNNG